MMNKSDFLDELRLQIGAAYDHAKNREEFLRSMIKSIDEKTGETCSITLYRCKSNNLTEIISYGTSANDFKLTGLGAGFFSQRQLLTGGYVNKEAEHGLYIPIPGDQHTSFFVTLLFEDKNYTFTEEDRIFISEVLQFIYVKQSTFK